MKAIINHLLSPFNLELHGKNYIKRLRKSVVAKDAFQAQATYCRRPAAVFDVGANKGWTTNRYRHLFGEAVIHAFEPLKELHEAFWSNNPEKQNIILNNVALSDKVTTADFYVNKSADTSSLFKSMKIGASSDESCRTLQTIQVQTNTIDHYCRVKGIDRIDILKLDTQGSELTILHGAKTMLAEKKISLIYTEAFFQPQYEDQPLFYELVSFLNTYDYLIEDMYEPYYNDCFLLWCDAIFIPKQR